MKKYMCNYHFIAEGHDVNPSEETECSGITEEEANKGLACSSWCKKMIKM